MGDRFSQRLVISKVPSKPVRIIPHYQGCHVYISTKTFKVKKNPFLQIMFYSWIKITNRETLQHSVAEGNEPVHLLKSIQCPYETLKIHEVLKETKFKPLLNIHINYIIKLWRL